MNWITARGTRIGSIAICHIPLAAKVTPRIKLLTTSGMPGICDAIVDIERTLNALEKNAVIFPPAINRYRALAISPEFVKVVIVGQDPYHGLYTIRLKSEKIHSVPEAMGLSFSVPKGVKIPPSLRNIFKELNQFFMALRFT